MSMTLLGLDEKTIERRSLAGNEVLFRQGDKVAAIYFVEAGRLRLERRAFDDRLLILGVTPVRPVPAKGRRRTAGAAR
jgi:CRP-like cAMP-binding protein